MKHGNWVLESACTYITTWSWLGCCLSESSYFFFFESRRGIRTKIAELVFCFYG